MDIIKVAVIGMASWNTTTLLDPKKHDQYMDTSFTKLYVFWIEYCFVFGPISKNPI